MAENSSQASRYQIKVLGNLDPRWSDWFAAMDISTENGRDGALITVITGTVADQAALRGLITRIWNLNLVIRSFCLLESECESLHK